MLRFDCCASPSEVVRCLHLYEESAWMRQIQMKADTSLEYNELHCHWRVDFPKGWTTLGKVPKQTKYHCPQFSWRFHSWKNLLLIKTMQKYCIIKGKMQLGSDGYNQAFHLHECLLGHWKAVWAENSARLGVLCMAWYVLSLDPTE